MIYNLFKVQEKELNKEEKLNFAIEASFVTLTFGVIISQILITIIVLPHLSLFTSITRLLGYIFVNFIVAGISMLFFTPVFRGTIFLLEVANMNNAFKHFLTILIGVILLLIVSSFYFDLREIVREYDLKSFSIFILPYIISFIVYGLYRNIWNYSFNVHKETDSKNILDHSQWEKED